jgi:6,7-dimethyl-8-ribityllumazine synthase
MSGIGVPPDDVTAVLRAGSPHLRVGVVAARWHQDLVDGLVEGAMAALRRRGIEEPTLVRVPGTFELAVAARALADQSYDAVIALGVVIRGDTPHFEYVCQAATVGLTSVSTDTGVPIGFGVLTCDTQEQAVDRCGLPGSAEDKGAEAAAAAVATALVVRSVRKAGS